MNKILLCLFMIVTIQCFAQVKRREGEGLKAEKINRFDLVPMLLHGNIKADAPASISP